MCKNCRKQYYDNNGEKTLVQQKKYELENREKRILFKKYNKIKNYHIDNRKRNENLKNGR